MLGFDIRRHENSMLKPPVYNFRACVWVVFFFFFLGWALRLLFLPLWDAEFEGHFLPVFSVFLAKVESLGTDDASDYEYEVWKQVLRRMRIVSNLLLRNCGLVVRRVCSESRTGKTSWTSDRVRSNLYYKYIYIFIQVFAENRIWPGIVCTVVTAF